MYNLALFAEPVSAANNTIAGVTNTSVQSLINSAAAETFSPDSTVRRPAIERLNSSLIQCSRISNSQAIDSKLVNGNVLLCPTHDMDLSYPQGNLHLASGSMVFVMKTDNEIAIYVLHQDLPSSVNFVASGQSHKLFSWSCISNFTI